MSLIERIRADQVLSRKAYDVTKASLLTTLIGEAEMIGKNAGNRAVTDEEVVGVIKKFVKNMNETIGYIGGINDVTPIKVDILREISTLSEYLPKQMTDSELELAIGSIVEQVGKDMGKIMGELRRLYVGRYDGKMASSLVKNVL
jgi:uncharacterized protein